jgi:hypothetical protein
MMGWYGRARGSAVNQAFSNALIINHLIFLAQLRMLSWQRGTPVFTAAALALV